MKRYFTKATQHESGTPRRSLNWARARRAWFEMHGDRVRCGDWVIPAAEVQGAVLYVARQLFWRVTVLEIRTAERTYQFGFNPWARPERYLPFEAERQTVKLGHSRFSIAMRLLLVIFLVLLLWQRFG